MFLKHGGQSLEDCEAFHVCIHTVNSGASTIWCQHIAVLVRITAVLECCKHVAYDSWLPAKRWHKLLQVELYVVTDDTLWGRYLQPIAAACHCWRGNLAASWGWQLSSRSFDIRWSPIFFDKNFLSARHAMHKRLHADPNTAKVLCQKVCRRQGCLSTASSLSLLQPT